MEERDYIKNIHIHDYDPEWKDHLPIGLGKIDFKPILIALREINYSYPITLEFSLKNEKDIIDNIKALKIFEGESS